MKRACIINIAGISPRLLQGIDGLWIQSLAGPPRPMEPTVPVVRDSVEASMTTGTAPGEHGVIGGGIFRRQYHRLSLDERSNTLLNRKRFWHARDLGMHPKVAMLFWSQPLAGGADIVVGAGTYHLATEKVFSPPELQARLEQKIGSVPLEHFFGPRASVRAAEWVSQSAEEIWNQEQPDLLLAYLPGVDFALQRYGHGSPEVREAIQQVDAYAQQVAELAGRDGADTFVVSDGGYVPVTRFTLPNVHLRRADLLVTRESEHGTVIDYDRSRAFAMVDHQFAHVFCDDDKIAEAAESILASDPAVERVITRDEAFCTGLGHDRAGERILLAAPDAWFSYHWWEPGQEAPAGAEVLDSRAKCGYDPCELFPGTDGDRICPDPSQVRASRGRLPDDPPDWCVLACSGPVEDASPTVTDLPRLVLQSTAGVNRT
ncbi:MAG: alkaline phosphatase family protein [Phycisphaerae bacterium]